MTPGVTDKRFRNPETPAIRVQKLNLLLQHLIAAEAVTLDETILAFKALVGAPDQIAYFTGPDTMALTGFTSFGRSLVGSTGDVTIPVGKVTIGATAAQNAWAIGTFGTTIATTGLSLNRFSANVTGPQINLGKSRSATVLDYTIPPQAGDELGRINFTGAVGVAMGNGAAIVVQATGAPVGNVIPSSLDIRLASVGQPTSVALFSISGLLLTGATGITLNTAGAHFIRQDGSLAQGFHVAATTSRPWIPGRWYEGGIYSPMGGQALSADVLGLAPFTPARDCVVDQLAINVIAPVAGGLAKVAVYASDASGYPGALMFESGNIDISTAGVKAVSAPGTLYRGQTYWLGGRISAGATLSITNHIGYPGLGAATADVLPSGQVRRTLAFATAAPANFAFTAADIANGSTTSAIMVRMRAA